MKNVGDILTCDCDNNSLKSKNDGYVLVNPSKEYQWIYGFKWFVICHLV